MTMCLACGFCIDDGGACKDFPKLNHPHFLDAQLTGGSPHNGWCRVRFEDEANQRPAPDEDRWGPVAVKGVLCT
jgi:hypothetical protein